MKKRTALLTALALTLCLLAGCGGQTQEAPSQEEKTEIIVFAAASMTETLTELGDCYMADHPDVTLVFNFDSSGTLKTQIQEGAACDVFISAGQKQMDQMDLRDGGDENTEGLDLVLEGTRFDILENKVALAVPEGNPADIHSYEDVKTGLTNGTILMAMGNADVPVGQYTQKILAYYGLVEEDLARAGCITYGSKSIPVVTLTALTCAEATHTELEVGGVYYGEVKRENGQVLSARLYDMAALYQLAGLVGTMRDSRTAEQVFHQLIWMNERRED